ncbi:MAG TPA: bifunctional 4-hydroxy-2-oxoglutarate aldolase/2-dehydro-3-deoxy-phosphogluconate aldolase [Candidatus Binatia bacterium]|nr:bifunctional 4-hydroxy-2-oxoglutarate aldolase/2-dehydro-3-deoxy-phosphogluconate aldolase [Candidatus Binatia bacterium]
MDVLGRIADVGIVPVIEISDAELAVPLADALLSAGLPCAEITFRTAAAADAIKAIAEQRPGVLVGAGTVLTSQQLDQALDAGARFVVSPGFDAAVVGRCLERIATPLPGVVTPTEVQAAIGHGLGAAKFFPAEAAGGPAYLRALAGPFPAFRFIPSGGITLDNLERYLAIPSVTAVGSSWPVASDLLAARDLGEVESRAREMVLKVRRFRQAPSGGRGRDGRQR